MVRKELEEIARTHPDQFDLWYTLDRPPIGTISSALTHHGSASALDHFEDWSLFVLFLFYRNRCGGEALGSGSRWEM